MNTHPPSPCVCYSYDSTGLVEEYIQTQWFNLSCKQNGGLIQDSMDLFALSELPAVFDRILDYVGHGCELCFALTSKPMLCLIAQSIDKHTDENEPDYRPLAYSLKVSVLRQTLYNRGMDTTGLRAQLSLRLTGAGMPRRSALYFLTTASLRKYTSQYLWLREALTDTSLRKMMNQASRQGQISAIKMLRQLDPPVPWDGQAVAASAAGGGHLKLLKWLRRPDKKEGQCPWDEWTCAYAAKGGHLEVLKWLRQPDKPEGQCPWDTRACWYAAEAGHRDVLPWLRLPDKPEGQCPWDVYTCAFAAKGGQLEALRWLRRPGKKEGQCPWDERTCADAAEKGHVEVLQWLRLPGKVEGQCPWGVDTCNSAAKGGQLWVLQWLRQTEKDEGICPWNIYTPLAAARANHLHVLKWLRSGEDKCPWHKTWCRAVTTSMEVREWLRSTDEPVPTWSDSDGDWDSEEEEYDD